MRKRKTSRTKSRRSTKSLPSITIKGFTSCPYFQRAIKRAKKKKKQGRIKKLTIKRYSRKTFFDRIDKSCPLVLIDKKKISGYSGLKRQRL